MQRRAGLLMGFLLLAGWSKPAQVPAQGPVAFVVSPGVSPQREAQRLLRVCRWRDTTALRDADLVLVVVRSSGSQPLEPSYDSLKWLRDAASSQLNDSGAQFHIYLYTIQPDLSLVQSSHQSYDVPGAPVPLTRGNAPLSPYPTAVLYPCG